MKRKLLTILLFSLIFFTVKSQSPVNLPSVNAPTGYYNIGWMKGDSGIINVSRDTTVRSKYAGLQVLWQHNGVDTNIWFNDGVRYFRYLKTAADVFNTIGGIPVLSLTTNNTSGPATLINGVLNIPNYQGGGGGGGNIISINTLTNPNLFIVTGTSGSDFNINSVGSTITLNIPTGGPATRGLISTTDWSAFNAKQAQLNGTGFVKASGSFITYDNSTYYLASNPNLYIARTSLSALTPILYNSGTGVISADTTPGLTHLATQAFALANGGSGGINVVGNLSPLFNSTVISNNLSFSFINAPAFNVFGNFTGSPGAPTYGLITTSNMAAISGSRLLGNPNGSSATPSLISLGYGLKFTGTSIAFDSALVKDTVFAVNGLSAYGSTGDSLGLGGRLYQNTIISGANAFDLTYDSFPAASGRGFRVNFGSDAAYDMIYRDSATGHWTRGAKGTPGQVWGMLPGGGLGWVNQSGGGGTVAIDVVQTYTSGTTLTQTTGANIIQVNPSSTQATLAVTSATTSNWHNSNDLFIIPGGTLLSGTVITNFSFAVGAGLTLVDDIPPNTLMAGHRLWYHKIGTIIYRMKD